MDTTGIMQDVFLFYGWSTYPPPNVPLPELNPSFWGTVRLGGEKSWPAKIFFSDFCSKDII